MKSALLHLVLWILLAVAAIAGYGYWYSVIADKSAAVALLQQEIDNKSTTAERIAASRATLAELAKDEASVQAYFIPETGVVPFINDLQARALAQKAELKVLSVGTGGTSAKPVLTLSLTLDGTFDAVMRALGAIEYAPYSLSVAKASLSENGENVWHADLELTVGSVAATATSTPSSPPSLSLYSYDHL